MHLCLSTFLSLDSDVHSTRVEDLQDTNSELETKCNMLTEQLSTLSNDLQSAEDVNLNLVEKIDHLKEEIEKKCEFFMEVLCSRLAKFVKDMKTLRAFSIEYKPSVVAAHI